MPRAPPRYTPTLSDLLAGVRPDRWHRLSSPRRRDSIPPSARDPRARRPRHPPHSAAPVLSRSHPPERTTPEAAPMRTAYPAASTGRSAGLSPKVRRPGFRRRWRLPVPRPIRAGPCLPEAVSVDVVVWPSHARRRQLGLENITGAELLHAHALGDALPERRRHVGELRIGERLIELLSEHCDALVGGGRRGFRRGLLGGCFLYSHG